MLSINGPLSDAEKGDGPPIDAAEHAISDVVSVAIRRALGCRPMTSILIKGGE